MVKNKILKKNCLVICFANEKIGSGHLFRSQILASSLKKKDWNIFLFGPSFSQKNNIKKNIFKKIFLINFNKNTKIADVFVKKIYILIHKLKIDCVIIDSYLIGNNIQRKIKNKLILKITNINNNHNFCDFILDYSFKNKIKKKTNYLLGPKYSLISAKINQSILKNKKILITFGGSNLINQYSKIITIIKEILPDYKIYFSTTSSNYFKILKNNLSENSRVILSNDIANLINKYKFEFIISSMGHTLYELVANNYPALFIKFFENQNLNSIYLKKTKYLKLLDLNNKNFFNDLKLYLNLYKQNNNFFKINKILSKKINQNGADIVAEKIDYQFRIEFFKNLPVLNTRRLSLVPLSKKNSLILFNLRKEILNKNKNYFKNNEILRKENHLKWFKDYFYHNRIDYLIYVKKHKKFIGALSYKIDNDKTQIGKYISNKDFKGKKYGFEASKKWLSFGVNKLNLPKVIAVTHKKNDININLNKKLGFRKTKLGNNEWLTMIYR